VFQNEIGYSLEDISPNGRWLALTQTNSNADSNLFLVDMETTEKQAQLITPHDGDVQYGAYTFTTDSQQLIYGTNAHGEFNQAWVHDIETQKQMI
jgi:prolyl oligopeptidase